MLDINFIRENPDKVREAIKNRKVDTKKADFDKFLKLDKKRSELIQKIDSARAERNKLSQGLTGKPDQKTIKAAQKLRNDIKTLETELAKIEPQWQEIMNWFPNIPRDEVPIGKDESENAEIKAWIPGTGYIDAKDLSGVDGSKKLMPKEAVHADKKFKPRPHWEIGTELDLIDTEAGSKVAGSRFYYLKNEAVLIMDAIFHVFKKKLLDEGFTPMTVPILVKEEVLYGTSHFPGDADQVYKIDAFNVEGKTPLYLIGSSEPSLFGYYMDKTLKADELPVKIMALSSCFRSEAGSWGKDVRGIKRTHQFDKLEIDMIIENDNEKAVETHEYLLSLNEWIHQQLEIPYHVINMCTADLGYYAAAKKYDPEGWLASEQTFIETGSDSITTDYQARRMNIKYQDKDGKTQYAQTVNCTGAVPRLLICILDHYQQSDGSVLIPKLLQDFVGKDKIEKK